MTVTGAACELHSGPGACSARRATLKQWWCVTAAHRNATSTMAQQHFTRYCSNISEKRMAQGLLDSNFSGEGM